MLKIISVIFGGIMNQEQVLGLLRHVVTFVGGLLVARGKIDPTDVDTIGGGIIAFVGWLMSHMAPEKATALPPAPVPAPAVPAAATKAS